MQHENPGARERGPDDPPAEDGCAYVIDGADAGAGCVKLCNAPRREASSYCSSHHALCRLPKGGTGETRTLREIEALADTVGGKQGRPAREPPEHLLRRLDRVVEALSWPIRSRYVQEGGMATRRTVIGRAPGTTPAGLQDCEPTPERRQHGPIERLERTIGDAAGRPARPYRAVDTLAIMHRRGSISAGMRQAGDDFRTRFAFAQLDPLRALDLSRLRVGERSQGAEDAGPALRIEASRAAVWRAVQAVGGIGSPAGSCLWHVVGWERSLKEWALQQGWSGRRVSQEAASGILIAALGALESHFQTSKKLPLPHFSIDKSGSM